MPKTKRLQNKNLKLKNLILILVVLTIIAITTFYFIKTMKTANAIKEQKEQEAFEEWFVDNCDCVERERIECTDGFKLEGNLCRNETLKIFTNVLKACSKYDCNGEIKEFNFEEGKWEMNE